MTPLTARRVLQGGLLAALILFSACAPEEDKNYLRGSLPASYSLAFDTVEVRREARAERVEIAYEREVSWPDVSWSGVDYVLQLIVTRLPALEELGQWLDVTERQEVIRKVTLRRQGGYPEDENLPLPRIGAVKVRFDLLASDCIEGEFQIHFADQNVLLGGFSARASL